MNTMLTSFWQNKHTSGAAVAFVLAKLVANLGAIWFPNHAAQCKQTADLLESFAVGYGFLMAGDAAKKTTTDNEKAQ